MTSCGWRARSATGRSGLAQGRPAAGLSADPAAGLCGARLLALGGRHGARARADHAADPRASDPALVADPDLGMRFQAAAGACLQLALVVLAIGLWRAAERALGGSPRPWLIGGAPGRQRELGPGGRLGWSRPAVRPVARRPARLAVWSVAGRWRFPEPWPQRLSLERWLAQRRGACPSRPGPRSWSGWSQRCSRSLW